MDTEKFNYALPKGLVAYKPVKDRGESRLMVIDRNTGSIDHKKYSEIVEYIASGDISILNNTKVEKIRHFFLTNKGGKHEVLFLPSKSEAGYNCLIGRSKKLSPGDLLTHVDHNSIKLKLLSKDKVEPIWEVVLEGSDLDTLSLNYGHTPLPPYIDRADVDEDYQRYNTIFAKNNGSAASPTASLNITHSMLKSLKDKGVNVAEINLQIGWGTFAPIRTDSIEEHKIHTENYTISDQATKEINKTINSGNEIWAFGTTVCRVLESSAYKQNFDKHLVRETTGETDLYIYPGYNWKVVDHLITNFHAPMTSLLTLVASFMGYDLMMEAYKVAIEKQYKFLSYGDSMLIL